MAKIVLYYWSLGRKLKDGRCGEIKKVYQSLQVMAMAHAGSSSEERIVINNYFHKNGPNPSSFCILSSFSQHNDISNIS